MERIQILIETWDRQELENIAKEQQMSMSGIIRELIRDYIHQQKKNKMRKAAELMENDYKTDPELTIFTDLDGEEFLNEA